MLRHILAKKLVLKSFNKITGSPDKRARMRKLIKKRKIVKNKRRSTDINDAIEITTMWQDLSQRIQETHPNKVDRRIQSFEKNVIGHYEKCIEDCIEHINEGES